MAKKLYTNDDLEDMLSAIKKDDDLKSRIQSHFSDRDLAAINYVMNDGYYEAFARYDSDVCEQFIAAWEMEVE